MNIKSTRISTSSGSAKVGSHVLSGSDNEKIELLHGSPEDLDDMVADARDVGAKFAMRHVIISPKEATTREQAQKIAADYMAEFGAGDRPSLLVEHKKARADGSFDRHWHLIIGEVSPTTGRVLDNRADFARHEKLARLAEIELGHALVVGRHNVAVFNALEAAGMTAQADALRHLTAAELPNSAFTSDEFQVAKRKGNNVAQVREQVRSAWECSDDARSFSAALAEHGLSIEQGRKKLIVVGTDKDGSRIELGSVDRLTKVPNADVAARMSTQENEHVREAEHNGRTPHDIQRSQSDKNGHDQNHRASDRGRGRDESARKDRGDLGDHGQDAEFHRSPLDGRRANTRTLETNYVQRGGSSRLQSLAKSSTGTARKAELKSLRTSVRSPAATASVRAAEATFKRSGAMSRLNGISVGKNPTAGGGGGGRSMDDIIKQQNGIQDASIGGGGGDGAPIAEGPDPEELAKASEAFTEAMSKLWRRFFGGKSESPPPHVETSPSPPGEELGTGKPVHAVAAEATPEKPVPIDPAAELGRSLAAYMRKVDKGTLKDGQKLADAIDRQPEGRKLRETIDAMHGDASLSDFAKRLPRSVPPSEIIRRIEQEAKRREQEAQERQRERTLERSQVAKVGAQPSAPALRMGR